MRKQPKCDFCNKPLSMNDCVLLHMVRWNNGVRCEKHVQSCAACYDFYVQEVEDDQPDNKGS